MHPEVIRFKRRVQPVHQDTYRVWFVIESNGLHAMVEVVSVNEQTAAAFAKRRFLAKSAFKVTHVQKIK